MEQTASEGNFVYTNRSLEGLVPYKKAQIYVVVYLPSVIQYKPTFYTV
jgi:hypothetical protein